MKKIVALVLLLSMIQSVFALESPRKLRSDCDSGNMTSCARLANMYFYGNGVEQNQSLAFKLFTKACDSGQPVGGCTFLGSIYRNGFFVEQDYQRALRILVKSCDNNEFSSCAELSGMYEDGEGVIKNKTMALKYREKACKGGYQIVCPGTFREKLGIK